MAQLISNNITDFSNRLEAESLIDDDLSDEIISMTGVGRIEKATRLLKAVQTILKGDENNPPKILLKVCHILCRYKAAESIAKKMLAEAGITIGFDVIINFHIILNGSTGMDSDVINLEKVSVTVTC